MKYKSFFSLLYAVPTMLFAQEFQSTGIGDTPEQAKKDAIVNAIKLSVGELIVSKEQLNNDDFTQNIVGYSNAYVKKIDVNSQKKLADGSYESNVTVDIESQKLLRTLEDMRVAVLSGAVSNEDLLKAINQFDQSDINKQTDKNFSQMVRNLLIDPIENEKSIAEIKIIGKLTPISQSIQDSPPESLPRRLSSNSDEYYPFELHFTISPSKEYVSNLVKIFEQIAANNSNKNSMLIKEYNINTMLDKNKKYKSYMIERDKFNIIRELFSETQSKIENQYKCIKIELLDKEGYQILEDKLYTRSSNPCNPDADKRGSTGVFSAVLSDSTNKLLSSFGYSTILPNFYIDTPYFSSGVGKYKLYLLLNRDEVTNLSDIKLSFSN